MIKDTVVVFGRKFVAFGRVFPSARWTLNHYVNARTYLQTDSFEGYFRCLDFTLFWVPLISISWS